MPASLARISMFARTTKAYVRGHHEAPVADDGQHGVAGPHDLGRDRAWQPGAHAGQRIVQQQAVGPVRRELPRKVHLPRAKTRLLMGFRVV